ncbi:MAG: hypothetical protein H6640_13675 [Caldilineaceae bacterium]|nr:hypothetical protein [Caldilineaceae bacterium]
MAVIRNDAETIIAQSLLVQEVSASRQLSFHPAVTWTLGRAHHMKGDRAAAVGLMRKQ